MIGCKSISTIGKEYGLPERRRDILIMTGLLILAVGLRIYGLGWGLPEVFEEATPLKKAWKMWGWDRDGGIDLNPHFFNYPSLVIYLHFLLQGLIYAGLKISGTIASRLDFNIMYLVDCTPIYLWGRFLSLLAGAGTVGVVYRIGRHATGRIGSTLAAFLLAINTYHVDQSQQITTDIPLTLFAILCLLFCVRILNQPTRRNYLMAGLALGLAASTKYTGALLVFPLMTAHLLARNQTRHTGSVKPRWQLLVLAGTLGAAVFVLTSPYVLLDFPSFWANFTTERVHMKLGHFGLDNTPAWLFYIRRLGGSLLGWPVLMAALAGIILSVRRLSRPWTTVLVVYLLVFLLPMGTWAMKADRYLLPVLPVIMLMAASGVELILRHLRYSERSPSLRMILIVAVTAALAIIPVREYPELWNRSRKDTRSLAKEWIEENLPQGSFIIKEHYGPDLLYPSDLLHLAPEITERLFSGKYPKKMFAVLILPMFQTRPERSEAYYDLDLYPDADYLITSSSVRSRYERDPASFQHQIGFYRELAARWEFLQEFVPNGGMGPRLVLYRNPSNSSCFGTRKEVVGPRPVAPSPVKLVRDEGHYFFTLGINYMTYGHPEYALECYRMGLGFKPQRPDIHINLILGTTQALLELGRRNQALEFLQDLSRNQLPPAVEQAVLLLQQDIFATTEQK